MNRTNTVHCYIEDVHSHTTREEYIPVSVGKLREQPSKPPTNEGTKLI